MFLLFFYFLDTLALGLGGTKMASFGIKMGSLQFISYCRYCKLLKIWCFQTTQIHYRSAGVRVSGCRQGCLTPRGPSGESISLHSPAPAGCPHTSVPASSEPTCLIPLTLFLSSDFPLAQPGKFYLLRTHGIALGPPG